MNPSNAGAATATDPRDIIAHAPMSGAQKRIIALTSLISALDGFDILSITFAAPVLGREFGLDSASLGLLLSSGLLGMLIGSLTLASLADIFGRRPLVIASLTLMGCGMLASAFCTNLESLAFVRIATGIGIGSMAVINNPLAIEFANLRSRGLALSLMTIGYPLGGMIGGLISAYLIKVFGWEAVFLFGASLTFAVLPLVIWILPESLEFLIEKRSDNALARVNRLLSRFGHDPINALPPPLIGRVTAYREIFSAEQRSTTITLTSVAVLSFITIYFFLSWQPKLLVEMGFSPSTAVAIASMSSLAGALGAIAFGLISRRVEGFKLAVGAVVMLGLSNILFGLVPSILPLVVCASFIAGWSGSIATLGMSVTVAEAFPGCMRATGAGFMFGTGRVGSALGPAIAGMLLSWGLDRAQVCAIIACSALMASVVLAKSPHRRRPLY